MPQPVHLREYRLKEIAAARVSYKAALEEDKKKLHARYAAIFRDLDREEALARNTPATQMERLEDYEGAGRSVFAEKAVIAKLNERELPGDSPELRRFRQGQKNPQSPEEHAAKAELEAPHSRSKWPDIAKKCEVPFTVTFNKDEVASILGFSLAGVDKLRKRGVLPYSRTGHRTLTFLPSDVRKFLVGLEEEPRDRTSKRKR